MGRMYSVEVIYDAYDGLVNRKSIKYAPFGSGVTLLGLADSETEIADRAARFLKAELKRAGLTYQGLAERLKEHGLESETEHSIKAKLKRGTFAATFFLAAMAAIGLENFKLDDL